MLEIMVVVGLMGLLAGVLAVGASRALIDRPASPQQIFWSAVGQAREFALQNEVDVRLAYDNETRTFQAVTRLGSAVIALPPGAELEIQFLGRGRGGPSVLIGGSLVETSELAFVTFFADGTCTPFRAQLNFGGEPLVVEVDPWTCAPALVPARGGGA